MKALGKFILLDLAEFEDWLKMQNIIREIRLIQLHHTYVPAYKHFKNENHFALCRSMENDHLARGFAEIGQNFTTFPDGRIVVCRSINTIPAGIKGANLNGICIENMGNFDAGMDEMSLEQKNSIISITKSLLNKFKLKQDENSIVYHHWYDIIIGKRTLREGSGITKSCPGTNFFGGNTIESFKERFQLF